MRRLISTGAVILAGCFAAPVLAGETKISRRGVSSWYHEGTHVACGGRYHPDGITAAHRSLPCGSLVTVTNMRNGRAVAVRINDRGPAQWTGRIIDLSRGAARLIDMIESGIVPVTITLEDPSK